MYVDEQSVNNQNDVALEIQLIQYKLVFWQYGSPLHHPQLIKRFQCCEMLKLLVQFKHEINLFTKICLTDC